MVLFIAKVITNVDYSIVFGKNVLQTTVSFLPFVCMLDKNAGKIKVQNNKNSIAHLKVLVL